MFERATTSWRAASSKDDGAAAGPAAGGERNWREGPTRAQVRALSRCDPLTPAEFKARRRIADQGLVSWSGVLDEAAHERRR